MISIIIIVKNDRGIKNTLEKLEVVEKPDKVEIIVVDASEGQLDDIRANFSNVQWIYFHNINNKKITIPEQRNLGVLAAKGEVIVFIDANCEPEDKWLVELYRYYKEENEDIVAGSFQAANAHTINNTSPSLKTKKYLTECPTLNVLITKRVFESIGYFDEYFDNAEDIDFMWRAVRRGYRIRYCSKALVKHDWGNFIHEIGRSYRYGFWKLELYKKHFLNSRLYIVDIVYPLSIILLPITYFVPWYPTIYLFLIFKNWNTNNPVKIVFLRLIYGLGIVIALCNTFGKVIRILSYGVGDLWIQLSISKKRECIVGYIGWLGNKNLRDEILYEAHIKLFKKFILYPYRDKSVLGFLLQNFSYKFYQHCFLGGGTLINQDSIWLKGSRVMKKNMIPLFCFGTGVNTQDFWSKQKEKKWSNYSKEWTQILKTFKFVGVRGPYSKDTLDRWGIKSTIVGDTALSLAPSTYRTRDKIKLIGINYGIVSGNPIWGNSQAYSLEVVRLINRLINKGFIVHLLPIWEKDVSSNNSILSLVNNDKCKLIINYQDMSKYFSEVNKCDLFIGQKLHSSIISTMHRIPTLMVEYRPKCLDYMASINMSKYNIRTSDFTANKALAILNDLIINKKNIQEELNKQVIYYKNLQKRYSKELIRKLEDR